MRVERLGELGTAADLLRALGHAAERRSLPPPAALIGEWFGSAAVSQIAHRAREHVHSRRRRFDPIDPDRSSQITTEILTAAASGDVAALMAVLAPDVVFTSDSDGKVSAARRPVFGAEKVARFILGLMQRMGPEHRIELAVYNGAPALVVHEGERPDSVITVDFAGGRITNFYAMRNPEKLVSVTVPREISR